MSLLVIGVVFGVGVGVIGGGSGVGVGCGFVVVLCRESMPWLIDHTVGTPSLVPVLTRSACS